MSHPAMYQHTCVGLSLSSKPSQVSAFFSRLSSTFRFRLRTPADCLGLYASPLSSNLAGATFIARCREMDCMCV